MPSSAPPPRILCCLPGPEGAGVARGLANDRSPDQAGLAVTAVPTLTAFLQALHAEGPWRAALLQVADVDAALVRSMAQALPQGLLVLLAPAAGIEAVVAAETAGAAALLPWPPPPGTLAGYLGPYLAEGADIPIPETAADDMVVGESAALVEAWRTAARVAATRATVLVLGASGTGKELMARALHNQSPRASGPFVTVNCAALPGGLLEAELFGYERGAFTGAVGRSDGRFGRADGGTLFLDEVGELELPLQAKLLRAIETGEIDRLGGGSGDRVRVDVRLVAATHRNLEARVREGAFREDLLYRLAVVTIPLPPLRNRPGDLRPLALHFASLFAARYGRPVRALSREAMQALEDRPWPGNVRELRNVVDRGVLLARGGVIRTIDLAPPDRAPHFAPPDDGLDPAYPATLSLKEVEERHIRRVLQRTGGHLGDAAEVLGVHRNTMTSKLREYGIDAAKPELHAGGGA